MQINSQVLAPAILNLLLAGLNCKLFETKTAEQLITGYKGILFFEIIFCKV